MGNWYIDLNISTEERDRYFVYYYPYSLEWNTETNMTDLLFVYVGELAVGTTKLFKTIQTMLDKRNLSCIVSFDKNIPNGIKKGILTICS